MPRSVDAYSTATNGFDYSIQIGASDKGWLSIVLSIDNDYSWRKIEIIYLVHARNDIWVGSFVGNSFQWVACDKSNGQYKTAVVQTGVVAFNAGRNIKTGAVAFISGIRTQNKNLVIEIK